MSSLLATWLQVWQANTDYVTLKAKEIGCCRIDSNCHMQARDPQGHFLARLSKSQSEDSQGPWDTWLCWAWLNTNLWFSHSCSVYSICLVPRGLGGRKKSGVYTFGSLFTCYELYVLRWVYHTHACTSRRHHLRCRCTLRELESFIIFWLILPWMIPFDRVSRDPHVWWKYFSTTHTCSRFSLLLLQPSGVLKVINRAFPLQQC